MTAKLKYDKKESSTRKQTAQGKSQKPREEQQIADDGECEPHSTLPSPDHPLLKELEEVNNCIPGLAERLTVIDKIGEGTFSSVYKAVDENYYRYDNRFWDETSNVGEKLFFAKDFYSPSRPDGPSVPAYRLKRLVAIKRIYKNSAPSRIYNEIEILQRLRHKRCIIQLIFAVRNRDQTLMVMPYFKHFDFRIYMHMMSLEDIRRYCYDLFTALFHVHELNVVHRDIKPSNFLYDVEEKKGVLVDFGLAQYISEMCPSPTSKKRQTITEWCAKDEQRKQPRTSLSPSTKKRRVFAPISPGVSTAKPSSSSVSGAIDGNKRPPGYFIKDNRPAWKAPRAGTRGFRAPEVLFKVSQQTTALDIWSAGVILLSLLTKQFPFFNSSDDQDAIVELACLFGSREISEVAQRYNRRWRANLSSVIPHRLDWSYVTQLYNPAEKYPDEVFDFLEQTLKLHHQDRIKASHALDHPYLRPLLEADSDMAFRNRIYRLTRRRSVRDMLLAKFPAGDSVDQQHATIAAESDHNRGDENINYDDAFGNKVNDNPDGKNNALPKNSYVELLRRYEPASSQPDMPGDD